MHSFDDYDDYFVASLNKMLTKQLSFWWVEMPWCLRDLNTIIRDALTSV